MKTRFFEMLSRIHQGLWRRIRNHYYYSAFHRCGTRLQIDKNVHIINPGKISVGNHVIINRGAVLQGTEGGRIIMGDNVTISFSAKVLTANLDMASKQHVYKDVIIGNNVWISANSIVLPGVVIDDNVIVAAGAVVTSRLDSGFIYGGIPASRIKAL